MIKKEFILTFKSSSGVIETMFIYEKNKHRAKQKGIDTVQELNEGCSYESYRFISLEAK